MKLFPEGKRLRHAGIPLIVLVLLVLSSSTRYASPAAATSPPSPPSLGTAIGFGVLAGSAVTNTGASVVFGNLGVSPGIAVTGFPPGNVTGATHKNDATAVQAKTDLASAYNAISGDSCSSNLSGQNLGGLTLTPGVYCFSSAASLTGTLTLNFQGDNSAAFIFKIGSALTTASSSSVVMTNGDIFCNVFWQVGSSAALGTDTAFDGNILALASITLGAGASIAGGALARNGAVTLDANDVGACPTQPVWTQEVQHTPTPSQGCFEDGYPRTVWVQVSCGSGFNGGPATVGNGNDFSGYAGSLTDIGFAEGSFNSASVTSEYDTELPSQCSSEPCRGFYSLQLNTQNFSCTPTFGNAATCWEQFIFDNVNGTGYVGAVYIQYQLLNGYGGLYGCPTNWNNYTANGQIDCWINSDVNRVPFEDPTTQLDSLTLSGQSNFESSGEDIVALCNGGNCYAVSESDTNYGFDLANSWNAAEFNIFGFENYSSAVFNTGASMNVNLQEQQGSGSIITPTCENTGFTGETNSLSLSGSCSVSPGYYEIMSFAEHS